MMALGGIAMASHAALASHSWHYLQFLALLVIAVVASRLKLKLPGLNGNMSVNLPLILIALAELSLAEALIIACVSTFVQCIPKGQGKIKPVQALFNVSTMAIALGLGGLVFQNAGHLHSSLSAGSLLLALASGAFFLTNTLPVATIISLSEGPKMLKVWASIFHLSFPYYVASAGITSIVMHASRYLGWHIPLLVLPVMFAIYRSYELYFGALVLMAHELRHAAADVLAQSEFCSSEKVRN